MSARSRLVPAAFFVCALGLLALAPPSNSDFSFAILGDRTGESQPHVYSQAWKEIEAFHPDFVINVGDTIQGGNDATADAEWRQARAIWSRYRYPFYFTPGNHDIWSGTSRELYRKYTGRPPFYSFQRGEAHFTVLDNSDSLQLSEAQLRFLERDLQQDRSHGPKFVFFHQPFWLLNLKLQSTDFPFHQLMRKYHVDYVVCGHVHQYSRSVADGIVYLVVGSSGGHLRGRDPAKSFDLGWFYQYVQMHVHGNEIEATVKELDPPFGQGRKIDASLKPSLATQ